MTMSIHYLFINLHAIPICCWWLWIEYIAYICWLHRNRSIVTVIIYIHDLWNIRYMKIQSRGNSMTTSQFCWNNQVLMALENNKLQIRMLNNIFPQKGQQLRRLLVKFLPRKNMREPVIPDTIGWQIQLGIGSFIDIQFLIYIFLKLVTCTLNCKWKTADNQCSFSSSKNMPMPTWSTTF